jgi:Ca2+-dependent lipid-binding protein
VKYGGGDIPGSPFAMNSGQDRSAVGGSPDKSLGALEETKKKLNAGPLGDLEGTLLVDLIKARNLVKADIMGKSDPYAILKFGKQKDKTNTVKNTLEPQWDHHAKFKVPDGGADKLIVEVFDADKLGKDKSLGRVEIDILDLTAEEGNWYPLQGREECLILTF